MSGLPPVPPSAKLSLCSLYFVAQQYHALAASAASPLSPRGQHDPSVGGPEISLHPRWSLAKANTLFFTSTNTCPFHPGSPNLSQPLPGSLNLTQPRPASPNYAQPCPSSPCLPQPVCQFLPAPMTLTLESPRGILGVCSALNFVPKRMSGHTLQPFREGHFIP